MTPKDTTGTVPPAEGWDEQHAVTGRPVDVAPPNTTFAERAKARKRPDRAGQTVEDKSVTKRGRK